MKEYFKVFKVKDKNNKLMSFRMYDDMYLWAKIKDLNNIRLNAFPVYDDRYIKANTRKKSILIFVV